MEQRRGQRRHVRRRRRRPIENNGADTASADRDEVYTAETLEGGGFKFSRLPNPAVPAPGGAFDLKVKGAEKYVNSMLGGNDRFSTLDPAKPVTGIAVTLDGGEGDDALKGTDGADTLKGDPATTRSTVSRATTPISAARATT